MNISTNHILIYHFKYYVLKRRVKLDFHPHEPTIPTLNTWIVRLCLCNCNLQMHSKPKNCMDNAKDFLHNLHILTRPLYCKSETKTKFRHGHYAFLINS